MFASGFASAPISQALLFYAVTSAVLVTATDTKHYFGFSIGLHLLRHQQWWRLLTWQTCFVNSTEVLFAAMTLYQLRVIERLWGSAKLAAFLVGTLPLMTILPPITAFVLRLLTGGVFFDHLPAGMTAIIFGLVAQYHAAIPYTYRYRVGGLSSANESTSSDAILLTSKSLSYLPPLQLALSQLPGSLISAAVGWLVGYAWRLDLLPFPTTKWRIPAWILGGSRKSQGKEQVERMRQRMTQEHAENSTTSVDEAGPSRRR